MVYLEKIKSIINIESPDYAMLTPSGKVPKKFGRRYDLVEALETDIWEDGTMTQFHSSSLGHAYSTL